MGRVAEIIASIDCREGDRLFEARIATQLQVSRAPVRAALNELMDKGYVSKLNNKGYVLAKAIEPHDLVALTETKPASEEHYMAIANDRLDSKLPAVVKEQELVRRYGLSLSDLRRVLARILAEGWVERLPGYGWRFSEMLDMPDAHVKLMGFRRMFEPQGLLEPTFSMAQSKIEEVRRNQQTLLDKDLGQFTPADLFFFGCEFHEALASASGNPFLLDALKRVNTLRRLHTYRSNADAYDRIKLDVAEHLHILGLIERGELIAASQALQDHLTVSA